MVGAVLTPTAYVSKDLPNQPVISVDNINCLNTTISNNTGGENCNSLGTNAISISPALPTTTTPITCQYDATGRKTLTFTGGGTSDFTPVIAQTFSSGTLNTPIPDWTGAGCGSYVRVQSTIAVAGYSTTIPTSGITVTMNLSHTYDGDLIIWLVAPTGDVLLISYSNGGSGNNYVSTVLSDGGATNISVGTAPFTNTYKPDIDYASVFCGTIPVTVTTFGALGGGNLNPNGNWTLNVEDAFAGVVGTLDSWSISFPASTTTNGIYKTYTDFTNMKMSPPSAGTVIGQQSTCPSTRTYSSSVAGTSGFTYTWSCVDPGGGTSSIASPTSSTTDVTYTNTTGGDLIFPLTLTILSECCGNLTPVTYNVTVYAPPATPVASASPAGPLCTGGSSTYSVTPVGGINYVWYNAALAQVGTGTSYNVASLSSGANVYYAEAINSDGCPSIKASVTVTGDDTPPVSPGSPFSRCNAGIVTVNATLTAGSTYNWYDASTGGNLLQTGPSNYYNVDVPTPSSQVTVYVSQVETGCGESSRTAVTATSGAGGSTTTWDGSDNNNWFDPNNWSNCVPTEFVDAIFPTGGGITNECSITFANAILATPSVTEATARNIQIGSGRTLTLGDTKAVLNVYGNWENNTALTTDFNAGTGLVIFSGTGAQAINGTTVTTFYNLTNNNSSRALTLNLNVEVSGTLYLEEGVINLNTKKLTISNSATNAITRTCGYIYSEDETSVLQWNIGATTGAHKFPFGYGGSYIPTTFNNSGASGNITTSTRKTTTSDNTPWAAVSNVAAVSNMDQSPGVDGSADYVIDRWWDFTSSLNPTGVTTIPAVSLTLSYRGAENTMTTPADRTTELGIQHWTGTVWNDGKEGGQGSITLTGTNGVTTGVGSATATGLTQFSPHVLVKGSKPLPIELLSFSAECNDKFINLFWSTASEKNNEFFTIERSTDAQNFYSVLTIKGANNSNSIINYSATDNSPLGGISYYRLKQTDIDGRYTYSQIIVACKDKLENINLSINLYPNPSIEGQSVYLDIDGFKDKEILVVVLNILGEKLFSKVTVTDVSSFVIEAIDSYTRLSPGTYFVIASSNSNLFHRKLVIK